MPADKPSALDSLQAEAQKLAAEAAVRSAAERAAEAGNALLDDIERTLFDHVGGAAEAVQREESADPLERARARYAVPEASSAPAPARPSRAAAEQKARAELERLKAALKKP